MNPLKSLITAFVCTLFTCDKEEHYVMPQPYVCTDNYKAPIVNFDWKEPPPRTYSIRLKDDYTIEEHLQYVGDPNVRAAMIWTSDPLDAWQYAAELYDAQLAAVRADCGVLLIAGWRTMEDDEGHEL